MVDEIQDGRHGGSRGALMGSIGHVVTNVGFLASVIREAGEHGRLLRDRIEANLRKAALARGWPDSRIDLVVAVFRAVYARVDENGPAGRDWLDFYARVMAAAGHAQDPSPRPGSLFRRVHWKWTEYKIRAYLELIQGRGGGLRDPLLWFARLLVSLQSWWRVQRGRWHRSNGEG